MKILKSIQLILLLNLITFISCDRVKENPEPDLFLTNDLKPIEISAVGGSVIIDVVQANGLFQNVIVSFDQPSNGRISADSGNYRFRYTANIGFEGKENFSYKICRNFLCKRSDIKIEVTENQPIPCNPVYSTNETYELRQWANPFNNSYKFRLHPGDSYCPKNVQKIDSYPTWIKNCSIQDDSIRFEINKLIVNPTAGTISYSNCGTPENPLPCKIRNFYVRLDTNKFYCDRIFKVNDMPITNISKLKSIRQNIFIATVDACQINIDPYFFEWFVSPNLEKKCSHDENTCSIRKKMGGNQNDPYFIKYIFKNMSGVKDTGQVNVTF